MSGADQTLSQLPDYASSHGSPGVATLSGGQPVDTVTTSLTAGPRGPLLMKDLIFLNTMANFDRERIPERVVHAKGAGAFGTFTVTTEEAKQYCKAKMFDTKGKKTPLVVRFSTVGGGSGSADTVRDVRGFAIKFYTEEGNWDMTGLNTPIFFIAEPMLFASMTHATKKNPVTNVRDPNSFWDFFSLRPESINQLTVLFSDAGIPDGYRYMDGFGSHTFKNVNSNNKVFYVKYHFLSNQGLRTLTADKAAQIAGADPDYSTRDLYNAIATGDYPSWDMYIQVMSADEAEKVKFDPFDITKEWSKQDYPLKEVGTFKLDKNPTNYFQDVESVAFAPSNMIPGIEPSPDRLLQGRLFSYQDTHRHRLGPNFEQLPVNRPAKFPVTNYERDGFQLFDNQGGAPNYFPNSFGGPVMDPKAAWDYNDKISGSCTIGRYDTTTDIYTQATARFTSMDDGQRDRLTSAMAKSLSGAQSFIRDRMYGVLAKVDQRYSDMVKTKVNAIIAAQP
ncbi:catalase [Tribonema minus]|uniref:Catalase n=1 Tax=Tribonema minus TaxID=303371 RepID=A0A835YV46_9STRA|nr:catalase [Tribonema minus]